MVCLSDAKGTNLPGFLKLTHQLSTKAINPKVRKQTKTPRESTKVNIEKAELA